MSEVALVRTSTLRGRRTFIYLALSLMTASWITGMLWAFLGGVGPPLPVTLVILTLLILIPLGFSRWLRGLELGRDVRRGILTVAFVLLALLVVSSGFYNQYGLFGGAWVNRLLGNDLSGSTFLNPVTSLVLVALCWWLGLTLGDIRLTSTNLTRYFYVSLTILLLPAIFFVSDVSQGPVWLFYVLLFASMVALGLGRVEEVARRSQDRSSTFTFYWLLQISLIAGLLLGIVAVAQVLRLGYGFGLILILIAPIVSALIFPIVYAGAKLLILSGLRLTVAVSDTGAAESMQANGQTAPAAEPSTFQSLCAGLLLLLVAFLVIRLIIFAGRRWREMAEDTTHEEKVALPSLGDQMSEAVVEGLTRLRVHLPRLGRLQRSLASRSIRRVYAAMVALAAERGYPRPRARTPYEHLWALHKAFPGCGREVERITDAYVAAHYGQVPDTREELQQIQAAWAHLRQVARQTAPATAPGAAAAEP